LAFFTQTKVKLFSYLTICSIGFWGKRQFFAENCQKSQKIAIITSAPDLTEQSHFWHDC
jgi:hypothetical protein